MAAKKKTPDQPRNEPPIPAAQTDAPTVVAPLDKRLYYGAAAVLFLLCLWLYVSTMEPGSPFWDSGEFIASAYILGIPHAPCTPLYVLVGRVFTLLPLRYCETGRSDRAA